MIQFSKSALLAIAIIWAGCLGFAWLVPSSGLVKFLPLAFASALSYAIIAGSRQANSSNHSVTNRAAA